MFDISLIDAGLLRSSLSIGLGLAVCLFLRQRCGAEDDAIADFQSPFQKSMRQLQSMRARADALSADHHKKLKEIAAMDCSSAESLKQIGLTKRTYDEQITQILVALDGITTAGICDEGDRAEIIALKKETIGHITRRCQDE